MYNNTNIADHIADHVSYKFNQLRDVINKAVDKRVN